MKNMKTSKKLMISFSIVTAMALFLAGVGVFSIFSINRNYIHLYEQGFEQEIHLREMQLQFTNIRMRGANFCMEVDYPDIILNPLTPQFEAAYAGFNAAMDEFLALNEMESDKDIKNQMQNNAEKLRRLVADYKLVVDDVRTSALNGARHLATQTLRDAIPITNEVNGIINEMLEFVDEQVHTEFATTSRDATIEAIILIVIAVLAGIFSFSFAFYISAQISKPLTNVTDFMMTAAKTGNFATKSDEFKNIKEIGVRQDEVGHLSKAIVAFIDHVVKTAKEIEHLSGGNLTVDIDIISNEDILGLAMKHIVKSLNETLTSCQTASHQVSEGSRQISEGAQLLAAGSTEQSASIEDLSMTIRAIADKTNENAEMAEKAARLSNDIRSNAEKGDTQMNEMTAAIREINAASQNIGKVIKVIDDIAFQTNILALNAAVEAARAGAHGKGFAVVADEVRNLAAKSAEAAKETSGMIQNSIEKAELGSKIATDTAASFTEISSGISESTRLVDEIANSSKEQATSISSVNSVIEQVAHVVAQNSATAEQSAASAEQMSNQSDMLLELISHFKLKK